MVLSGPEQRAVRSEKVSDHRAGEQVLGQQGESPLGDFPSVSGHRAAIVVDQQCSISGAHQREAFGRHADPAVPVFAGHQIGRFGKLVPKEELTFDEHSRTGQRIASGQHPLHRAPADDRLVDEPPVLVDHPEQLEEKPPSSILVDERGGPGQRPGTQEVVGVEEHDKRARCLPGSPVSGERPLPVLVIDHHDQIESTLELPGHLDGPVGGCVVHHHDLEIVELLGGHRFEASPDVGLPVVGRNHHREEGSIRHHDRDPSEWMKRVASGPTGTSPRWIASVWPMMDDPSVAVEPGVPQRILVVGGSGHVGAALTLHLAGQGHQVTATSRRETIPFDDLQIRTAGLDLARPGSDGRIGPQDTVVLCPWVVDGEAPADWVTDLTGTLVGLGVRSMIYFSSMWVYGGPLTGTLTEETIPDPTDAYGSAHLANEQALAEVGRRRGLDVSVLRMSNLIGADPLHRHRTKVSFTHEMAAMALHDPRIVLRSPPSTPRDLLARGRLHHDIDALIGRPHVPGRVETLNAGGGQTTTVGAFARRIAEAADGYHGRTVPIEHPEDPSDQPTFTLDSTKLRSIGGPHPNDLDREISMVFEDVLSVGPPR